MTIAVAGGNQLVLSSTQLDCKDNNITTTGNIDCDILTCTSDVNGDNGNFTGDIIGRDLTATRNVSNSGTVLGTTTFNDIVCDNLTTNTDLNITGDLTVDSTLMYCDVL